MILNVWSALKYGPFSSSVTSSSLPTGCIYIYTRVCIFFERRVKIPIFNHYVCETVRVSYQLSLMSIGCLLEPKIPCNSNGWLRWKVKKLNFYLSRPIWIISKFFLKFFYLPILFSDLMVGIESKLF